MKRKKEHKHYHTAVKNKQKEEQAVINQNKKHQSGSRIPTMSATPGSWKYYIVLAVILLLSFFIYIRSLKNGFVWDDTIYIINNNLIKDFSWKGIKAIFNNFSSDNYAPLTDLINAVQYKISGLNPSAFHLGSLVFHLVNVALVFWFIRLLCNRWEVAAIAALFFGIHPMQVESVAWVSAGSTLYCAVFFLVSLIAYLYYLRSSLKRYLFFSLLFFILSVLSKPVAVILPVVLLLIDYIKDRKITLKILLEKSPFLILSLVAGILSLLLKNQAGAVANSDMLSFHQRIIFAAYGFINYLLKLIFPLHLSAFYPYPVSNIPIQYYAYVVSAIGIVAYAIYSVRFSKKIFFGIGFFAVTVFLMLQLVPVGSAVMADRYSYLPFIGFFYLAGEGLTTLWGKKLKLGAILILCVFTVLFSVKTCNRCSIWQNDMTLWSDVISQYKIIAVAYNNRGNYLKNEKRNTEALKDFNKAIELTPDFAVTYVNRGNLYLNEKRTAEALKDYNKAIELKPELAGTYINRGNLYLNEKRNAEALKDYNKAIELKSDIADAYNNRGNLFVSEKRNNEAFKDFNRSIELNPDYAEAYFNRGTLFMNENRNEQALKDLTRAIELKPDYADAYNNRGKIYILEKRNDEALIDLNRSIELNPEYAYAYNNRGGLHVYEGRNSEALKDFNQAIKLKPDYADAFSNLGSVYYKEKRYEEAITNYSKAIALKTDYAQAYYNRGLAELNFNRIDAACLDMKQAASLGFQPAADVFSRICK
jgi:tetratricopeptide (TPR) repeat protein